MSIAVTPAKAPEPVQAAPALTSTPAKHAEPLFGDIAENTPTPIPSLAGC